MWLGFRVQVLGYRADLGVRVQVVGSGSNGRESPGAPQSAHECSMKSLLFELMFDLDLTWDGGFWVRASTRDPF